MKVSITRTSNEGNLTYTVETDEQPPYPILESLRKELRGGTGKLEISLPMLIAAAGMHENVLRLTLAASFTTEVSQLDELLEALGIEALPKKLKELAGRELTATLELSEEEGKVIAEIRDFRKETQA